MLNEMSRNYSRAAFIAIPAGDTTVESRRTYQATASALAILKLHQACGCSNAWGAVATRTLPHNRRILCTLQNPR